MLTLITYEPALDVRSPSPFTVKAEALLAMSGLPYQLEYGLPRNLPRGKLPILRVGDRLIPDSAHIQTYLENECGVDFDSGLSPEKIATATAFRRLLEHHLYFINMHFRWVDHADEIRDTFFRPAPALLRGMIFRQVQKKIIKTFELQGLGRHTREELIGFIRADVEAISTQLGDKKFLLDDVPTSIDASLYGTLHNMIDNRLDTPGKREALKHQNLIDYCARFKETVFWMRINTDSLKRKRR